MSKPNWKRRGLTKAITEKDRQKNRSMKRLEYKIAGLPPELREFARRNPHLV